MRLIVGLGNPGEKYENTRHNIGFRIVDAITEKLGDNIGDVKFLKPQTFMNDSGRAVAKEKNYYKIDNEDIVVIHDDVDLEVGKVRIALGGSSAGHKGVQSIIDNLGTENFWRVRVGVGRSDTIPTDDWVLKNFDTDMTKIIEKISEIIAAALETTEGLKSQTIEIG